MSAIPVRDASGKVLAYNPECDGCAAVLEPAEVLAGGGILNMGWLIRGRDYRCPTCKEIGNV